jgi:ATP-dependent Clp protease ATP-binding subunit ClpA
MFPNCPTPPLNKYINLKGLPNKNVNVNDTACTIFEFENPSYLGEFEAEFKKALAHESGAEGVLFDGKKTEGRKSRERYSFLHNGI